MVAMRPWLPFSCVTCRMNATMVSFTTRRAAPTNGVCQKGLCKSQFNQCRIFWLLIEYPNNMNMVESTATKTKNRHGSKRCWKIRALKTRAYMRVAMISVIQLGTPFKEGQGLTVAVQGKCWLLMNFLRFALLSNCSFCLTFKYLLSKLGSHDFRYCSILT
jgi:hypothetical protein